MERQPRAARTAGAERERRAPLELLAEARRAPLGEQVLEPGVPPVAPVAVVAEDRGHEAHGLDAVLGRHEAERLGQAGGGVALVVGHAEAAADQQVEARGSGRPARSRAGPTSWAQMSTQLSVERPTAVLNFRGR